jgi:hypothetical protein
MGLIADLLIRRWRQSGASTDQPSRKVTKVVELLVTDDGTMSVLTGIKRPTSAAAEGALPYATDTDSDSDPDDLAYSDVLRNDQGKGLHFEAVSDPAALSGTGLRARAKRAATVLSYQTWWYLQHGTSDVSESRVRTTPEISPNSIYRNHYDGHYTTLNNSDWRTVLTMAGVFGVSGKSFIGTGRVICNGYVGPLWAELALEVTSSSSSLVVTAGTLVVDTNVRVSAAGSDLYLQVVGPDATERTWFGEMELISYLND